MPYEKQVWVDHDSARPLSANRMNHMEDGIAAANIFLVLEHDAPIPDETPVGTIIIRKNS